MPVLKDFKCAKHGTFEGSHPICPHYGCLSEDVQVVHLRAPGHLSERTRRFDRGVRESARVMGRSNFRTTKEGETSAVPYKSDVGTEMLWGDESQKKYGVNPGVLAAKAAEPFVYQPTDGPAVVLKDNNGLRQLTHETKLLHKVLPAAEVVPEPNSRRATA